MKIPAIIILAIAAAFAVNAPAQTSAVKSSSEPGKASVERTVDVTATIIAIDRATRDVTLKGPKGNWLVVTAGPEVKNFDQMNVGDKVHARYIEALVLELKKGSQIGGQSYRCDERPGLGPRSAAARRRRPCHHRRCRCRRRQPRNVDGQAAGTAARRGSEGYRPRSTQSDQEGRSGVRHLHAGARDGGGGGPEEIAARFTALRYPCHHLCGSRAAGADGAILRRADMAKTAHAGCLGVRDRQGADRRSRSVTGLERRLRPLHGDKRP